MEDNKNDVDIITEAMDEEELEFTKTLTEELRPVTINNKETKKGSKKKKVKEEEESVDATDFVTREEFYGKENKLLKWLYIVLVVIVCVVFGYYAINFLNVQIGNFNRTSANEIVDDGEEDKKEEKEENKNSEQRVVSDYNEKYGSLYFYSENSILTTSDKLLTNVGNKKYLGMYNCESSACELYSANGKNFYSFADNTVLISDNGKGLIYDYSTNTIMSNGYDYWYIINNGSRNYLVAKDEKTNVYGSNGNNITKDAYQEFGVVNGKNIYEYAGSYIVVKKDNKYGVINYTNNKVVVDIIYDGVQIESDKIFTVKDGKLWYAVDALGTKICKNGYREIVRASENYMMVLTDSNFDIVDYEGKSLIDLEIKAPASYKRYNEKGKMVGIELGEVLDSVMTIKIDLGDEVVGYRFNVKTYGIVQYSE